MYRLNSLNKLNIFIALLKFMKTYKLFSSSRLGASSIVKVKTSHIAAITKIQIS